MTISHFYRYNRFQIRTLLPGFLSSFFVLRLLRGCFDISRFSNSHFQSHIADLGMFLVCELEFFLARPSALNTITVNCSLYVRNLCDQTLLQYDRYKLLEGHLFTHHIGLAFLAQGGEPRLRFLGTF